MRSFVNISLVLLGLVVISSSSVHHGTVLHGTNHLGEIEVRVRFGKLHALEVLVPGIREAGMYYRQVTDGRRFLQAVFQGKDNIIDCDMNKDKDKISKFLEEFEEKENSARRGAATGSNVTLSTVRNRKQLDPALAELLDMASLRRSCKLQHRRLRQQIRGTTPSGASHPSQQRNALDAFRHLQGQEVSKPETSLRKSRAKRSTFIYPGTKWCGNGNTASGFHDLGDNVATDKCCRGHDHCPYTISAFSRRYRLFNYRLHTLSHCQCDEMFRTCLRSAANSVADMVGNVFFNVVGMQCFTLKQIDVCSRRSWWGGCKEYKEGFEAEVNEPFEY